MSCNKSFANDLSGKGDKVSVHESRLKGELMSGNEFTIGHSVVPPASFANVGSFAFSSLLACRSCVGTSCNLPFRCWRTTFHISSSRVAGLSSLGACEGQFSSCLDFPPTRISHERNNHAPNDWVIYNAGKRGLLF